MKFTIALVLSVLGAAQFAFGKAIPPQISECMQQVDHHVNTLPHMGHAGAPTFAPAAPQEDTLYIVHDTVEYYGALVDQRATVIIWDGGLLRYDSCQVTLACNIYVMGSGRFEVRKSLLHWNSAYLYQWGVMLGGASVSSYDSVQVESDFPLNFGLVDSASFRANWVYDQQVVTNALMSSHITAHYDHCVRPFEFVLLQAESLVFVDCDSVLIWLGFGDSTRGEITLPGDTTFTFVPSLDLGRDHPTLHGLEYNLRVERTNLFWGTFPDSGCDVTLRDTRLRTTGLRLSSLSEYSIENLANSTLYPDWTLDLGDRRVRLVNSYVRTWNLYPGGRSHLVARNCLFGETLAQDSSFGEFHNSLCDGSGGWIGAGNRSRILLDTVVSFTFVMARDQGVLVMQNSYAYQPIEAAERGTLVGVQSTYGSSLDVFGGGMLAWGTIDFPRDSTTVLADTLPELPIVVTTRYRYGPGRSPETVTAGLLASSGGDSLALGSPWYTEHVADTILHWRDYAALGETDLLLSLAHPLWGTARGGIHLRFETSDVPLQSQSATMHPAIWPNPTTGQIAVVGSPGLWDLLDLSGRKTGTVAMTPARLSNVSCTGDLSGVPPGVWWLRRPDGSVRRVIVVK